MALKQKRGLEGRVRVWSFENACGFYFAPGSTPSALSVVSIESEATKAGSHHFERPLPDTMPAGSAVSVKHCVFDRLVSW